MSTVVERLTSGTLALAALAIAVVLVRREFFAPPASSALDRRTAVYEKDWKDFSVAGIVTSSAESASVQIVEFADFECPLCATFERTMERVTARYGNRVSRVFVHFPLPRHRFALPAARVAECAHEQGAFRAMKSALYAKQDSFGIRPWSAFARDAGIKDLVRFDLCIADSSHVARIADGIALGERIGLKGTPTFVINGWAMTGIVSDSLLVLSIDAALAGKAPPNAAQGTSHQ